MVFAKIVITIEVDEDELTESQQRICGLADTKPFEYDHVCQIGTDAILVGSLLSHFDYLDKGKDAVTIKVENG